MSSKSHLSLPIVVLVVGLTFVLAACGDSSAASSPSTSTPATAKSAASSLAAYRTCMAQHGVNLPTRPRVSTPGAADTSGSNPAPGAPEGGGFRGQLPPGVTQQQMSSARQACANLRPQRNGRTGFNRQAFAAYRSCMSDHGVTLPNRPATGTDGAPSSSTASSSTPPVTIDRTSPQFQAADAICRPLMQSAGGGSTTTSVPTA